MRFYRHLLFEEELLEANFIVVQEEIKVQDKGSTLVQEEEERTIVQEEAKETMSSSWILNRKKLNQRPPWRFAAYLSLNLTLMLSIVPI